MAINKYMCNTPSVVANVLDSNIVSKFELRSCYYVQFGIDTFGKGMNCLSLLLLFKPYHYFPFTMIALALNNPRKLVSH